MTKKFLNSSVVRGFVFVNICLAMSACSSITYRNSSEYAQTARQVVNYPEAALDSSKTEETVQTKESVGESPLAPVGSVETPAPIVPVIKIAGVKKVKPNQIPLTYNEELEKWIDYFAIKDRKRFQRFLDRGEPYKPYIQAVLSENDLPLELYYLAMIESGFNTHAHSRASAVGFWQFMKGTGRDYGLTVDYYLDERKDPLQATEAAASYLRDLYNALGSWNLAVAAYNCGESRVRRVIRKGRTRDFWKLARKKLLPRETRNYVPKFMAAIIIGQNPEKFGFRRPSESPMPEVSRVKVPGSLSLSTISRISNIKLKTLKKHNPHLRRKMTPRNETYYEIWVPKEYKDLVANKYVQLAKLRSKSQNRQVASIKGGRVHRVRPGQHLTSIARRYGVSVSYLKRINQLRGDRIYPNQKLVVSAPQVGKARYHVVRRGQTLSEIASRYGRSVRGLQRINGLRSATIYVGQKLKVQADSYAPATILHKVRPGENLTLIAKKYAAHVSSIKNKNDLRSSKILVGQKLLIPVKNKRVRHYRVKRGDNLTDIAKNFGATVEQIKAMNNLRSSRIYAGQTLKVIN